MTSEEAFRIAELCIELLDSETKWKSTSIFNEPCHIDSDSYTLGCALELMQLSVLGKSKSRNLIMRKVRSKIRRHFFWRQGWHPITNFNRHRKTSYDDVIFLLNKVKESLSE